MGKAGQFLLTLSREKRAIIRRERDNNNSEDGIHGLYTYTYTIHYGHAPYSYGGDAWCSEHARR